MKYIKNNEKIKIYVFITMNFWMQIFSPKKKLIT